MQENVYVNAATGNLVIQNTDEMLIGLGPDDAVARTYNSLGSMNDDNGDNWRASVSRKVVLTSGTANTAGSTATRTDWDGSEVVYTWDAGRSAYLTTAGAGAYDTITLSGNTWTWKDGASRVTELYDKNNGGRITSSADTDGNALAFTYNGSGLVSRVTTASGEYTDLLYTGSLLTQVETKYKVTAGSSFSTLTRVRYGYDVSNRLTTVTVDKTSTDNSVTDSNTYVTTYAYDGATKRVASITQTDGSSLTIGYTLVGSDYRVSQLVQTASTGVTRTTGLSYNTTTRVTSITDAAGQVTKMTYDTAGQLTKIELPPAQSGAAAQILQYAYNANGDVTSATDAAGGVTYYSYEDGNGNLTKVQDSVGNITAYTYDPSTNRLLTETRYLVGGGAVGNQAPLAGDDALVVISVGDSITFNPRLNDNDPDGDPLTITAVSTPSKGTATILGGGSTIRYTRTSAGADSFTYTISDGQGHTVTGTVTIAEVPPGTNVAPTAANDAATVTGVGNSLTFDPRANDSDPNLDRLTITAVSTPSKGTATIAGGGTSITYTRTSTGADSFTYTVSDGRGYTATATILIGEATGGNQAPTAYDDGMYIEGVGNTLIFDPRNHASDPDGDVLTITDVTEGSKGYVSIVGGGTALAYTRTAPGTDNITYTISDGNGHTVTAVMEIWDTDYGYNYEPVTTNDQLRLYSSPTAQFDPRYNDYDPEGEALTITSVYSLYGSVSIIDGGTAIQYTYTGGPYTQTLQYTVEDSYGNATIGYVTIQVAMPVNTAPVAHDDYYSIGDYYEFTPLTNDGDFERSVLTIVDVDTSGLMYGTVDWYDDVLVYTRYSEGTDYFTYTIEDAQGLSSTATVTISDPPPVGNQAPSPVGDKATVSVGSSTTINALLNDTDFDLDTLTITAVSTPGHGTATITGGGTTISYTRTSGGPDSFTYTVSDGQGNTATATVTISEPAGANVAPTAANDAIVVGGVGDAITFNPRINDADFNVDTLTITAVSTPSKGTVSIGGGGTTLIYTRTSAGADSFTYTISDGNGHTVTATVNVTGSTGSPPAGSTEGLTARYAYDAENHLRYAVSAEGHVTEYIYDAAGQVITTIEYTGHTYSVTGLAPGAAISLGALDTWRNAISDKKSTKRTDTAYDFRGGVSTVTSWEKTLTSGAADTSGASSKVTYVYDQAGLLRSRLPEGSSTMETYQYDGMWRLTSKTDFANATTTIAFDDPNTRTTVTLADGLTQVSLYNKAGELISYAESGTGLTTATTTYQYDSMGRLRVATDATGVSTRYLYDHVGRKVAQIDADRSLVEYRYNAGDQLIATIRYANLISTTQFNSLTDGSGNPSSAQISTVRPTSNAVDRWEWRVYDGVGRLVQTIDAAGSVTGYAYDRASRLLQTTQHASQLAAGTLSGLKTTLPLTPVTTTSDAADRIVRNFYDTDGRLIGTLDGEGYLTQVFYDEAGQKVRAISYATATVQANRASGAFSVLLADVTATANPADISNWFVYDGRGFLRATINGEGDLTRYRYTGLGYLDEEIRGQKLDPTTLAATPPTLANLPSVPGGTVLETTAWTRDNYGRALTQTRTLASGSELVTYTYDTQGRLLKAVTTGTTVDSRTQTQRYNLRGQLVGALSGEGSVALAALGGSPTPTQVDNIYATWGTTYVYDLAGRLIAKVEPQGTDSTGRKTRYYYDTDGNLTHTITDTNLLDSTDRLGEVVEYRYNVFGQRSDTVVYAGRINAATLATLNGGLVDTAVTNAVTAIANASADSVIHTDYNVTGTVSQTLDALNNATTYLYNAFTEVTTRTAPLDGSNTVQTTRAYDRRGLLLSSTVDAAGLNLISSVVYDAFGRAVQATDPNGKVRSTAYDRAGRMVTATDALGQTTTYAYDGRGNVLTVTDRNGKTTGFTYNAFNRQVVMTTAEGITTTTNTSAYGQTLSIVDGAGRTTTYTYDKNGALKTVTDWAGTTTNGYDKAGRLIEVTNALGTKTAFTYDAADRVLKQVADEGAGRLNLTTKYEYDGKGLGVKITDAAGKITAITFDKNGARTAVVVDTAGVALRTEYVYDKAGRMVTLTEGATTSAVRVTSYVYDKADRLTQTKVDPSGLNLITTYTYDKNGNAVARTDAAGARTRYVYDAENRLTWTVDAEGAVTRLTYDGEGRVTKTYAYATKVAAGTLSGWPLAVTEAQVTGAISTAASDRLNRTVYDGDGRATYQVDAEGYVTKYVYNGAGQATQKIRYAAAYTVSDGATVAGLTTLIGSPSGSATTAFAYDSAGRLTDVTDAEGVVTRYTLDAVGQATEIAVAYGTTDVSITRRAYDRAGRMTSETRGYGTPEVSTVAYGYDGMSRVVSTTDGRGYATTRAYDGAGRLLSVTAPLNATESATTAYEYDAVGNVVKVTDPRLNPGYFYYDKAGRLTLQIDPEGYATQTVAYSAGGEALIVKRYWLKTTGAAVGSPPTSTAHAKDATTTIARDKLDRVTSITDAEGHVETYALDAFGDRVTVTNKLGGVTTNTYDKRGLLLTETLPINSVLANGTVQATSVVNKYAYDARGNRTQSIEAFGLAEARTANYAYDKLDRLVSKSGDAVQVTAANLATVTTETPTETYAYDKRGNLIQTIDAAGAKTFGYYDDLNRKIVEVDALGGLKAWTYDANGNATSARLYGDFLAALPSTPGGTAPSPVNASNYRETLYAYDRNNRQIETKVVGLLTGEYGSGYATSTGDITTQTKYDVAGNVIQRIDELGNSIFLFYDKLGRQTAQVDQESYLTSYVRDAEGNVLTEERFATRLAGTVTPASDPAALRTGVTGAAGDRITTFTYDRNGRRLTETRLNVNAHEVTSVGALQAGASDSTITYAYNGLGQVTRKTEANGDYIDYAYDVGGRQASATKSAFTDYLGASVQHRTVYEYNGLNSLARMTERKASGTSADDRLTTFAYGAGGRMSSMTDATGFVRNYAYDIAGRVVKESYVRAKSDATTVTEARAWRYDALGRAKLESMAVLGGSTWTFGDTTHYRYNSFGEVTGRGITGDASATPVYQETFDYDAGGRLWRTNADTGSVRIFLYDKAGRVTLEIGSVGTDLGTHTASSALALLTNSGANAVGAVAVDGVVATITAHDKRGQAISTREPKRQLEKTGTTTFTLADIVRGRSYNAFGETASETNARGYTTDFAYNTMGRLVLKTSPEVSITGENGVASSVRPTEEYFYDVSGRLIATEDANGNVERRALLAGTGHGGAEAKVTAQFHADTSVERIGYDAYGDARKFTNGLLAVENRTYDKAGRVLTIQRPLRTGGTQLTETYSYDGLGHRLVHWNSQFGSSVKETTDYDYKGRVVRMQDFGGNLTTYSYAWNAATTTTGLGTFGGWTKTTNIPAGKTASEKSDYFGRMVDKVDYGAHDYAFTFDKGGRLTQQTSSTGQVLTYTWFNTGLMAGNADTASYTLSYLTTNGTSKYAYDADGNRVKENYAVTTYIYSGGSLQSTTAKTHQDAVVTWDALDRMVSFTDTAAGSVTSGWAYDAVGNVRRMTAGVGSAITQDYWYRYDAMNRFVTVKGSLEMPPEPVEPDEWAEPEEWEAYEADLLAWQEAGGTIVRGGQGTDLTYDAAGQRATATTTTLMPSGYVYDPVLGYYVMGYTPYHTREQYGYMADGYLATVHTSSAVGSGSFSTAALNKTYDRDALGRVTFKNQHQLGWTQAFAYNTKGEVTDEWSLRRVASNNYEYVQTWHTYTMESSPGVYNGAYLGGLETHSFTRVSNVRGDLSLISEQADIDRWFGFKWWDGPVKDWEAWDPNTGDPSNPHNYSHLDYDTNGHLSSVAIDDHAPHTVTYVTDIAGQVMERRQSNNSVRSTYLYFGGLKVADITWSGTTATSADFDQAFEAATADGAAGVAATAGRYTVRAGDSFQSIATTLWGDASLWWMIAEANGMAGDAELAAGMTLTIPAKVRNFHNTADTFRPYDPNKAQGNTGPVKPKPSPPVKGQDCGMAQILVAIIAIVVVAVVMPHAVAGVANIIGGAGTASVSGLGVTFAGAGTAAAASTATMAASYVVGGAIAGAAGSIISQGVGLAIGAQDRFSWNAVGLAAVGGAISGGLTAKFGPATTFLERAGRAAVTSTLTQGIGVATGMQERFSWAGVAVSAVAAGVGGWVGDKLAATGSAALDVRSLANQGISNLAGAIAGAGAQSLIEGSDFGDNLRAAMPSVIANTVGNMIAGGVSRQQGGGKGKEDVSGHMGGKAGSGHEENVPKIVGMEFDNNVDLIPLPAVDLSGGVTAAPMARSRGFTVEIGDAEFTPAISSKALDVPFLSGGRGTVYAEALGGGKNLGFEFSKDGKYITVVDGVSGRKSDPNLYLEGESYPFFDGGMLTIPSHKANVLAEGYQSAAIGAYLEATETAGDLISFGQHAMNQPVDTALSMLGSAAEMLTPWGRNQAMDRTGGEMTAWMAEGQRALGNGTFQRFVGDSVGRGSVELAVAVMGPRGVSGPAKSIAVSEGVPAARQTLYHYTNEAGVKGIIDSNVLNPSLKALNPKDARYGNGQYLSDVVPGTMSPAQLSQKFLLNRFQGQRFTHFVEVNVTGLNVVQGRPGVFVVPSEAPLDLTSRVVSSGRTKAK